jgi:hypothetical protein
VLNFLFCRVDDKRSEIAWAGEYYICLNIIQKTGLFVLYWPTVMQMVVRIC